jgi:imidazolonepropionase-like amidohydrolase
VLVRDGAVAAAGDGLAPSEGGTVLDVTGLVVGPGFVEAHSHVPLPRPPTAPSRRAALPASRHGSSADRGGAGRLPASGTRVW